jgi:hypothetical protein
VKRAMEELVYAGLAFYEGEEEFVPMKSENKSEKHDAYRPLFLPNGDRGYRICPSNASDLRPRSLVTALVVMLPGSNG